MFSLGKWATQQFTEWLTYEPDFAKNTPSLTNYEFTDKVATTEFIYVYIDDQSKPIPILMMIEV